MATCSLDGRQLFAAEPALAPTGSAPPEISQTLAKQADQVTSGLDQISQINKDGYLEVKSPTKTFQVGTQILLMRRESETIIPVARAKVVDQKEGVVFLEVIADSVIKAPYPGDIVTVVSAPWKRSNDGDANQLEAPLLSEPPPLPPEPGFLELGWLSTTGTLDSQTSNLANAYKKANGYSFTGFTARWFFEFAWQLGIEYENQSGGFPTSTYYRNSGDSGYEATKLGLLYRTRGFFNGLVRPVFAVSSITETFDTINPDEALVSSQLAGIAAGMHVQLRFEEELWEKPNSLVGFSLQSLSMGLTYSPSLVVKDLKVSRGQLGTNEYLGLEAGFSSMMYFAWMPLVKRLTIHGGFRQISHNIRFEGATEGESGGYAIPAGGQYKEMYQYWYVNIGVRMSDFIGRFLKPR